LLSYDRLAVLLFQALQRDASEDHRISVFGLRALLLQSQWSDANPYKQLFFQRIWACMSVPAEEEFDAASSRLSMAELSPDASLILSTIQRSAALIKEACAFAKDVLNSSSDLTLDAWRVIEFANFMTEEEADGTTVQRKRMLTRHHLTFELVLSILFHNRSDEADGIALDFHPEQFGHSFARFGRGRVFSQDQSQ
jgi:hypothetical protein